MACPHHGTPQTAESRTEKSKYRNGNWENCPKYKQLVCEAEELPYLSIDDLLEDTFSDEVLSYGIGKLKYPGDAKAASEFSLNFSDILTEVDCVLASFVRSPLHLGCRAAELLNEIGDAIRERYDIPSTDSSREFSCRFGYDASSRDMPTMDEARKPELALLERRSLLQEEILWEDVQCPLVLDERCSSFASSKAFQKLLTFSRRIFSAQTFRRRFVLGIALFRNHFEIVCFDRSGAVLSRKYDLRTTHFFARIIVGLLFADKEDIGYERSLLVQDNQYCLPVNEEKYILKATLHTAADLLSTGVSCFLAERDGEEYVIKDVWMNRQRKLHEQDILERARGIENVVQLTSHEVLKTRHGAIDSTELHTKRALDGETLHSPHSNRDTLDHHRLVITPYGERFETFTSLEELILAIRDMVKAIKDLSERDILHSDISCNNVIFAPRSDPSASLRRACLIDFGESIDLRMQTEDHKIIGTPLFMALDVLRAFLLEEIVTRKYYHDLESVLYLLCFACINHDGPSSSRVDSEVSRRSLIPIWVGRGSIGYDKKSIEKALHHKLRALDSKSSFQRRVLRQFQPYFDDVRGCAEGMYDVLFPNAPEDFERRGLEKELERLDKSLKEVEKEPNSEEKAERKRNLTESTESCKKQLAARHLEDQSPDEVFGKLLEVLDDTLDMLRKKAVNSEKEKESATAPEEMSADRQAEDITAANSYERNGSTGKCSDVEASKDISEIPAAVGTEASSGGMKNRGEEESANIPDDTSKASAAATIEEPCGQVHDGESVNVPKDTAEVPAAEFADDSCQNTEHKREEHVIAAQKAIVAASADAPCQRNDNIGKEGIPRDDSYSTLDTSCGQSEGKKTGTPALYINNAKRKRVEEVEDFDSDSGYGTDSAKEILKRRRLDS